MTAPADLPSRRRAYVALRMKALGKGRTLKAQRVAREGGPDGISGELLIALALRESGLRNVLGDRGHARGAFQIHDAYHQEFLRSVPGCRALTHIPPDTVASRTLTRLAWLPIPATNAYRPWMCPTWEDGARYAVKLLRNWIDQADVAAPEERLRIAVAAYNCGFPAAYAGAMSFDVDKNTTGGDYSEDVLRRRAEIGEWLRAHPRWRL